MAHQFRLTFTGDVMLGRLIDQLLPTSVWDPDEAAIARSMKNKNVKLRRYRQDQPWGNTLPRFHGADLNLINLETSVTTHPSKWPNKTFNYRMHPSNLRTLRAARIDYVSLANNHTLDFQQKGLVDTMRAVEEAGIKYAGAGHTTEAASTPATLRLSRAHSTNISHAVKVFAASDHPEDWRQVPNFHLIDYAKSSKAHLKQIVSAHSHEADLLIFSVHWGPNYAWRPATEIRELAHFLVDECGIDIVYGHSSHHVQGVEIRNGSLILYGCGDFVDDYALVPAYRNDLGAMWQVIVKSPRSASGSQLGRSTTTRLAPEQLEVFPTRIRDFQVDLLHITDPDHDFVCSKICNLSAECDTHARPERGAEGQLIFRIE